MMGGWRGCLSVERRRDEEPLHITPTSSTEIKPDSPILSGRQILKETDKVVLLYPEEGWARSAASSHWLLSPCWWSPGTVQVTEVSGTRRMRTRAKMKESATGDLYITGSFSSTRNPEPNFKLWLTSTISTADRNMGYCMTGSLDRGKDDSRYQTTHFAVIKRLSTLSKGKY